MLIDTHTHFYDEWLLPDAEAAIARALEAGVGKMVQADVDSRERDSLWEINDRHPGVLYPMVGLYPCSVGADWKEEIDRMLPIGSGVSSPSARSASTTTKGTRTGPCRRKPSASNWNWPRSGTFRSISTSGTPGGSFHHPGRLPPHASEGYPALFFREFRGL